MNRKEYYKKIYAKKVLRKHDKGFSGYDRAIFEYLNNRVLGNQKNLKTLEVAMGAGFPFANTFLKEGQDVFGVDISEMLVKKCQEAFPLIHAKTGDAENLPYQDSYFDFAYCFNSTHCFPDTERAVLEMLRVTKSGGRVAFDLSNWDHEEVRQLQKERVKAKRLFSKWKLFIRLLMSSPKHLWRGEPTNLDDVFTPIPLVPSSPRAIFNLLREQNVSDYRVCFPLRDGDRCLGIEELQDLNKINNHKKLVFIITKPL